MGNGTNPRGPCRGDSVSISWMAMGSPRPTLAPQFRKDISFSLGVQDFIFYINT